MTSLDGLIEDLNAGLWRPIPKEKQIFDANILSIFPDWTEERRDAVSAVVCRTVARMKADPRGTAGDRAASKQRIDRAVSLVRDSIAALDSLQSREKDLLSGYHADGDMVSNLVVAARALLSTAELSVSEHALEYLMNRHLDAVSGNTAQATVFLPMLISLFDCYHGKPPIAVTGKLVEFIGAAHRFAGWAPPSSEAIKKAAKLYIRIPEVAQRSAKIWGQGTLAAGFDL